MNNADLAERIAESGGLTKADARKIVDSVFAVIADAAASGAEVAINGFGKFKVKDVAAREGRSSGTGEIIQLAAFRKIGFTPAKAVKDLLNRWSHTAPLPCLVARRSALFAPDECAGVRPLLARSTYDRTWAVCRLSDH